jgi:hypothetical protein
MKLGPTAHTIHDQGFVNMTALNCPTPDKNRYADITAAARAAQRVRQKRGVRIAPYLCDCGWHHLTSRPTAPLSGRGLTGNPEAVRLSKFIDVVDRDIRRHVTPEEFAMLRLPESLQQWWDVLTVIRQDLIDQVKAQSERGEPDPVWREKVRKIQERVSQRRGEIRRKARTAGIEINKTGTQS